MGIRALGSAAVALLLMFFAPAVARASSCTGKNPASAAFAKSFGDVYNQLASDGDEEFPSYYAKLTYAKGDYAITWQSHHSKYASQHAGADIDTVVHTIAGPTISVPWFNPTEETNELRLERCTGWQRIYAGLGYLATADNVSYPIGYSGLRGVGIGIERYADEDRRWDLFTALYYYPSAMGAYGSRTLTFSDVTFDGGWRLRAGNDTGVNFGLYQEIRELEPGPGTRVAQLVRVAPYVGFQEKL
jgi:hypothetical protein